MKKLISFFRWSPTEKVYFFKALFAIIKICVFSLQKPTVVAPYYFPQARKKKKMWNSKENSELIFTVVHAVEQATSLFPGARNCLVQALAVQRLLEREGFSPQFQIGGIFSEEKKFEAHAWVEYEGEVIIGDRDDLSAYSVFRETES